MIRHDRQIKAGFILQLPFIPGLKSQGFQAILDN